MKTMKPWRKSCHKYYLLAMLSVASSGMAQTSFDPDEGCLNVIDASQQMVIVKDSITHEAIPFVSVYFGNESGGYTDEQGSIAIPNGAARIRLSHICYETKNIANVTVDAHTIFLVPKSISLGEVAVSVNVPKRIKTTEVGLMKTKTQTKHKGANGFEMALFIPFDSTWTETPYIHSILLVLYHSLGQVYSL